MQEMWREGFADPTFLALPGCPIRAGHQQREGSGVCIVGFVFGRSRESSSCWGGRAVLRVAELCSKPGYCP